MTLQKQQQLTIYLAGKVRGQKHEIASQNPWVGVEFICSDGSTHSPHQWGFSDWTFEGCSNGLREEVNRNAIEQLQRADMLFAYLDTPDSFGSIAEIAYFSALGKPSLVTVLVGGKPTYEQMFDAYWFVACFPQVRVRPVDNLGTASAILDELLGGFSWGVHRANRRPTEADIAQGYADAEAAWKEMCHARSR
jgi:hypothetical protein